MAIVATWNHGVQRDRHRQSGQSGTVNDGPGAVDCYGLSADKPPGDGL